MFRIIVRAFTEQGYHLDIAVLRVSKNKYGRADELLSNVKGIEAGEYGICVKPHLFPEVKRFEILVEEIKEVDEK